MPNGLRLRRTKRYVQNNKKTKQQIEIFTA